MAKLLIQKLYHELNPRGQKYTVMVEMAELARRYFTSVLLNVQADRRARSKIILVCNHLLVQFNYIWANVWDTIVVAGAKGFLLKQLEILPKGDSVKIWSITGKIALLRYHGGILQIVSDFFFWKI